MIHTRQSSRSTRYERVDSTSTRLAHGYLVAARLCFTPHLAVHRGIHTRRACVRRSQCHFFIVPHHFLSSVVHTPADCCIVTSTSGISCNLAVQFDIPPRQKTVFITQLAKLSFNHSIGRTHSWRFLIFNCTADVFHFFYLKKNEKTSYVSTTDWMVETQLCTLPYPGE